MAFILADRVKETATTTGTGNFTLLGAVSGFQAFDTPLNTGDTTYYSIVHQSAAEWEVGLGTFTATSTLARTTVLASSNAGAAVNFSAGTKDVFITLPASKPVVQGKNTIFLPAHAMHSVVTNPASPALVEYAANDENIFYWDFGTLVDTHVQFQIGFPKSWNESTVTFQVWWTSTGAVTTGVAWGLQGCAFSDGDAIDAAWGTPVVVTDDALGTANDVYVTAESSAVTIGGTPAADDMVLFRLFRDVSDANDDMTQDARLIGIKLFFVTDAGSDA